MTPRDYLKKILELCSGSQRALFDRMYPNNLSQSQLSHATLQIENTLKKASTHLSDLSDLKHDFGIEKEELQKEISLTKSQLSDLQRELRDEKIRVEQLSTPENVSNADVQERLDLLEALEQGGVDNWEWYDESIDNYKNSKEL